MASLVSHGVRGLLTAAAAVALAGAPLSAQLAGAGRRPAAASPIVSARNLAPMIDSLAPARRVRPAPLLAPIASFIVPGSGQVALRQPRAAAYFAVEIYELLKLVEERRNVRNYQREYRRIAREVARRPFGGSIPDAPWHLYEMMEEFTESGRYTLGAPGSVVPETDPATFNGHTWQKARQIYFTFPDEDLPPSDDRYQRALAYYRREAAGEDYRWSWRNASMMQRAYIETISMKNAASHDVRVSTGIIIANHLLSGIDGFASVRLRRADAGERRLEVTMPLDRLGRRSAQRR